ncbi:MAG: hypothetical protein RLZ98_1955 [Pseudomonadota bacterium]|jgi:hypothetical protein
MNGLKKLTAGLLMALALVFAAPLQGALAQDAEVPEFTQMKLTDQHLTSFIAAQGDLAAISKRIEAAGDKEDPKLDADLEALAKKYGFASFEQLEDVASNIMFVLDVTDPKTGEFRDPKEDIKAEMAEIDADKSIPADEKKKRKEQLQEDMKAIPNLKFKENLAVVNKHREALEKAMQ